MVYKNYKEYTLPYIVVHYKGYGVMEDPYIEQSPLAQCELLEDAKSVAKALFLSNNDKDAIKSGWCINTYQVNVNTGCKAGKVLYKEFSDEFEKLF